MSADSMLRRRISMFGELDDCDQRVSLVNENVPLTAT
jgi:hypothetical protein